MGRDTYDRFERRDRGLFGDNEIAPARPSTPRVTGASDLIDLDLYQHAKTASAVLVSLGTKGIKSQWLPLSQCQIEETGRMDRVWDYDRSRASQLVKVTLPIWLATSKGLI
jgi:hypothetical protein